MRALASLALVAAALTGCEHFRERQDAPDIAGEERDGRVRVYLEALPAEAERLSFSIGSVLAVRSDGSTAPLEVAAPQVRGAAARRQVLLSSGRLPPGGYRGLLVAITAATLAGGAGSGASALLVPKEPVRVEAPFVAEEGRTAMVWIGLGYQDAIRSGFEFTPAFGVRRPPPLPVPQLVGYCSNAATNDLTVFDRLSRDVFRSVRTGRRPGALAVDRARRRLYVALAGEGEILVVDAATAEKIDRIRLDPGDAPRDLALASSGNLLLSVNERSNTVSFVDPLALQRTQRLTVGEEPSSVVVDAAGVRAYVLNRRSSSITILDLANRAVVTTVRSDPHPVAAALSRDGRRLYVTHGGSPFLVVHAVPHLAEVSRVYFGRGTRALTVDPRTDLVYLGLAEQHSVMVVDPTAMVAMSSIDVGGEPRAIVVDPSENRLLVLVPDRRVVVVVDLATLAVAGTIDVGADPQDLVVMGGP
jgi:YVTN family beta-propeller protein